MADKKEFPKVNGDLFWAEDANVSYYQALNSSVLNYDSVEVTDSSTLIISSNSQRKKILIRNYGDKNLFIGQSNVTVDNGKKLTPNKNIVLNTRDEIYGISESDAIDVRYLEVQ